MGLHPLRRPGKISISLLLLPFLAFYLHADALEHTLHQFTSNCYNGPSYNGISGLTADQKGNLYGIQSCASGTGWVFELSPNGSDAWNYFIVHTFPDPDSPNDGVWPTGNLTIDPAGNLYGATQMGGESYAGTVFELTPAANGQWAETILYSFGFERGVTQPDGVNPYAGVTLDSEGNLYGTNTAGGTHGFGTVFELHEQGGGWSEQILHNFGPRFPLEEGYLSYAELILDAAGNLYGTTRFGGVIDEGTVFEMTRDMGGKWTEKILYSVGENVASNWQNLLPVEPLNRLVFDSAGNLYGTAGTSPGSGTAFRLSPLPNGTWVETSLVNFGAEPDGVGEPGDLSIDAAGNLYGVLYSGGHGDQYGDCVVGYGAIFRLTPSAGGKWNYQVVYGFTGGQDGCGPGSPVTFDSRGNLYTTTNQGGNFGYGTAVMLTPSEVGNNKGQP